MAKSMEINIPVPDMRILKVTVQGISSLICHRWSTKARKQIEDKQGKKARKAREVRDPEAEYLASLYPVDGNGTYGFPAAAFKHAMIGACRYCQGVPMTFAKGAFFVMGDILPIKGSKPRMRTDMVRVPPGRGGADIAYRGEFPQWSIELSIRYNTNVITPEQIMNLLALAGISIGVGEQRPSAPMKPGSNGMWEVVRKGAKRKVKA